MSTATPIGDGRYRHRESRLLWPEPPRARALDAGRVTHVLGREVDKALAPVKAQLAEAQRQLDAIGRTNAATEEKLGSLQFVASMRDNVRHNRRCPTPEKVNAANRARHGRDAEGRRPGDTGYGLDAGAMRDAVAGAPSLAAAVNAANRMYWGRS